MNERIQELLIQSEVFNKDRTVMKGVTGYELNKFAQLIVQECDRYARSAWEHGDLLGRDLLIHFGVKE